MVLNAINLVSVHSSSADILSKLSIETFKQAYSDVHSAEDLEAWCIQNYSLSACETLLAQPNVEATIAYRYKSPVGFYTLKHHPCPVVPHDISTELKQIYILKDYYGLGLADVLFNSAKDKAISNGSDWLWLCVSDLNHRALKYYTKMGFQKIGTGPGLIVGKDRLSSSIMSLNIYKN